MVRVKRGVVARKRHKKIIKLAKGYYSARSRVYSVSKQAVIKAGQYAYRDRRKCRSFLRASWIKTLNYHVRLHDIPYSVFIYLLNKSGVLVNRNILSLLSVNDPSTFILIIKILVSFKKKLCLT